MKLKNVVKHLKLITNHKWVVFKLCCKVGQPWRGFCHDFSKYTPTEFFESVNYYVGTHSPIIEAKRDKGYSNAWLHHKGRNKHHPEYWVDTLAPNPTPVMPYKYAVEMICDKIAAGIIYRGDEWTKEYQLTYWKKEKNFINMNDKVKEFVESILIQLAEEGIDKTLTKKNIKEKYKKYCEE